MTLILNEQIAWQVAQPGESGVSCPQCSAPLSITLMRSLPYHDGATFTCPSCTVAQLVDSLYLTNHQPKVLYEDAELLSSVDAVRSRTWFHATKKHKWLPELRRTWDEESGAKLIHVGSYEAAVERALVMQHLDYLNHMDSSEDWSIHEVRLAADTIVSDEIMWDDNDAAPEWETDEVSFLYPGYSFKGVTRYVNSFELPGSISLLVNSRRIRVKSSRKLDAASEHASLSK